MSGERDVLPRTATDAVNGVRCLFFIMNGIL